MSLNFQNKVRTVVNSQDNSVNINEKKMISHPWMNAPTNPDLSPSFPPSVSSRQHHRQVRAGPTHLSIPTSRSWRSLSPACLLCPQAPQSTSWVTGRPTKIWVAGTSTTTGPLGSGPGSHHAPGILAAAPAVPEETVSAQRRVRWGVPGVFEERY